MIKPIVLYKRDDKVTLEDCDTVFIVDAVDCAYALLHYLKNDVLKVADWYHFSELTKVH